MLALKEQEERENCSSRMQTELTIERDLRTRSVTSDRASVGACNGPVLSLPTP